MYDLVIEGGTIVDGSGAASFIGSVYLQGGRIAHIQAEDSASHASNCNAWTPAVKSSPPASSTCTPTMTHRCSGTPC